MSTPGATTRPAGIEFYGGYEVYSESGVDLTLLRENLTRTIEVRFEQNARALTLVAALDEAGRATNPWMRQLPRITMLDASPILQQLIANQVDFVLIGGLAMVAQGSAHITKDLDICYSRTPASIAALAGALASAHPYLRGAPAGLPFRFDPPTIQAGLNFTLVTDWGEVDLLGEVRGIGFYEQVLAMSEERTVFGLSIHVLSLDGLIAAKKAAGRGKDQQHLLELIELKKLRDAQP